MPKDNLEVIPEEQDITLGTTVTRIEKRSFDFNMKEVAAALFEIFRFRKFILLTLNKTFYLSAFSLLFSTTYFNH